MGQYIGLFDKELQRAHTLSNAIFYTSIFIKQLKQHRLFNILLYYVSFPIFKMFRSQYGTALCKP